MVKDTVLGISVEKGVLTIIDPEGNTRLYRHPLVDSMAVCEVEKKVELGKLAEDIMEYHKFPDCWEIETEEPEITGDLATMIDSL